MSECIHCHDGRMQVIRINAQQWKTKQNKQANKNFNQPRKKRILFFCKSLFLFWNSFPHQTHHLLAIIAYTVTLRESLCVQSKIVLDKAFFSVLSNRRKKQKEQQQNKQTNNNHHQKNAFCCCAFYTCF